MTTALIGVIALAGGFFGWLIGYATVLHRALLLIAAGCLIKPGLWTDMVGFGLLALVLLLQWTALKRAAEPEHTV